ncbi:hypothetical protein EJB05_40069, partial [Eragrostis curvula]
MDAPPGGYTKLLSENPRGLNGDELLGVGARADSSEGVPARQVLPAPGLGYLSFMAAGDAGDGEYRFGSPACLLCLQHAQMDEASDPSSCQELELRRAFSGLAPSGIT